LDGDPSVNHCKQAGTSKETIQQRNMSDETPGGKTNKTSEIDSQLNVFSIKHPEKVKTAIIFMYLKLKIPFYLTKNK